jgi:hypothetical protein
MLLSTMFVNDQSFTDSQIAEFSGLEFNCFHEE